jgi:hypothetical protein
MEKLFLRVLELTFLTTYGGNGSGGREPGYDNSRHQYNPCVPPSVMVVSNKLRESPDLWNKIQRLPNLPVVEIHNIIIEQMEDLLTHRENKASLMAKINILEGKVEEERRKREKALSMNSYGQQVEATASDAEVNEAMNLSTTYSHDDSLLGNYIVDPRAVNSYGFQQTINSTGSKQLTFLNTLLNLSNFNESVFGSDSRRSPIVTMNRESLGPWISYWKNSK